MSSFVGYKEYQLLIEVDSETGVPTGNQKPNSPGDPDYIPPSVSPDTCPPYTLFWRGLEDSRVCVTEELSGHTVNTGTVIYVTLEEVRRTLYPVIVEQPTGNQKPNSSGDPDYIPPVVNTTSCPLPIIGWEGDDSYCGVDGVGTHTGYLHYLIRKKYIEIEGIKHFTGEEVSNENSGDPDYIPPVYNTMICPLTRPTGWRPREESSFCEQTSTSFNKIRLEWDSRVFSFDISIYRMANGSAGQEIFRMFKSDFPVNAFSHIFELPDNSNYTVHIAASRTSSTGALRRIRIEIPLISFLKSGAGYVGTEGNEVQTLGQDLVIQILTSTIIE